MLPARSKSRWARWIPGPIPALILAPWGVSYFMVFMCSSLFGALIERKNQRRCAFYACAQFQRPYQSRPNWWGLRRLGPNSGPYDVNIGVVRRPLLLKGGGVREGRLQVQGWLVNEHNRRFKIIIIIIIIIIGVVVVAAVRGCVMMIIMSVHHHHHHHHQHHHRGAHHHHLLRHRPCLFLYTFQVSR